MTHGDNVLAHCAEPRKSHWADSSVDPRHCDWSLPAAVKGEGEGEKAPAAAAGSGLGADDQDLGQDDDFGQIVWPPQNSVLRPLGQERVVLGSQASAPIEL